MTTARPPKTQPEAAMGHLVVRASAGAGKTFTLSSRYLKLLRRGVKPQEILATTFTRKAAGEILERVLRRLADAASSAAEAKKLTDDLKTGAISVDDARALLAAVARRLDRVAIATIDSFMNRMATSFRHELGLPHDPAIVGDGDARAARLRQEAIEALLADADPQVLIDLLRRLHHDSTQRSVTAAIDTIVRGLYDTYREAPDAALWATLEAPAPLSRTALLDACANLERAIANNPVKAFGRALEDAARAARLHDWESFIGKGLAKAILDAPDAPVFSRKPVPPELINAIAPLLQHAEAELVGRVARATVATHELLRRFDAHYSRLRRRDRVLLFSDLPHKLARELPQREELLNDVYFRLNCKLAHLLLDEFQDTSSEQWRVLKRFAQEICSHRDEADAGQSFFCVGDVKQSIYGWRGGCPEIFENLEAELHLEPRHSKVLSRSYRSAQVLLDVVNTVCGAIGTNTGISAECAAVAVAWQNGFEPHTAVDTDRRGYVELITSPAEPDRAARAPSADDGQSSDAGGPTAHDVYTAQKIAQIAAAAGGKSIGVLVSTNDAVRRLINLLLAATVDASGEGGNPVTDDACVGVVLAALALADHPADTIAAFHVGSSPLAATLGLGSRDPADTEPVAARIRHDLQTHGYGDVIARWADALLGHATTRNAARLSQVIELADRYDAQRTLRTRDFIDYVRATPVEEPTPAPIRVMTVHRAKGLEFDIVVLPDLDRPIGRVSDAGVYVDRATPAAAPRAIYRACNESIRKFRPELQAAHDQVRAARFRDDLSTLYVAMTRPRSALHMIIRPTGINFFTPARILRCALLRPDAPYPPATTLFTAGDPEWFNHS